MEPINHLLVGAYFIIMLLALFLRPANNTAGGYLLAARRLTIIPFVATLVTTSYGWILGTGQLYYEYGYFAWFFLNLPYTVFSLLFAFFFSKKLHAQHLISMPDLLEKHYNKTIATLGSILILLFISPAMYVLMAAQIIHYLWHWPMVYCIAAAGLFSVVYVIKGGFNAVVKTDVLQFVFMFGGFFLVFFNLYKDFGFKPVINASSTILLPEETNHIWYILSWYLFASITLVDPNYHQRIHAAKDAKTAKLGMIISVVCWLVFDFLSATIALYALWLNPQIKNHSDVYLYLATNYLPNGLRAIFFIALLATVFSTANSFFFTSALTMAKDILHRNKLFMRIQIQKLTALTLMLLSLFVIVYLFSYTGSTAVDIFFDITPYVVSGLLLPVLGAYFNKYKLRPKIVFIQSMLAVLATAIASTLKTSVNEVFYGVITALLIQIIWLLKESPKISKA